MAVYGIDLGTTYSCIAKLDVNGNPQVISNITDASDTLASAIYFETLDNVIIGQSAKEYVETDGENVVQFIKREIGKEEKYGPHIIHGKEFTPVELSALILKRVKEMAEEQGEEVKDVIITCPAYFGFKERDLTKKAGEIAGLNVLNLINEPTAAALNYCSRLFQEETNILVYDLGGGTFDVTLVHMSVIPNEEGKDERQIRIIATGGNDTLGGKDWDDKLFEKIRNQVCDELGLSVSDLDVETIQSIRSKVEVTKKKLTQAEKAVVKVSVEGQMVKINVTREEFEELTKSLVDQTMSYVEGTLDKAKKVMGEEPKIDTVLLVGGSTNMPMIKRVVEERFPGLVQVEDPDRAVAKGAAIYADMIVNEISMENDGEDDDDDIPPIDHVDGNGEANRVTTQINQKLIVDVAPRSFGPAIYFGDEYLIDNLVKEGQEINQKIEKEYVTIADNQKKIVFPVYESHSVEDTVKPCFVPDPQTGEDIPQDTDPSLEVKKLGELVLNLSGNDPKGTIVYVEFTVQPVGIIIKVTLSTDLNVTKEEVIHYDNGISQEDIEQMTRNLNRVSITGE